MIIMDFLYIKRIIRSCLFSVEQCNEEILHKMMNLELKYNEIDITHDTRAKRGTGSL